MTPPTSLLLLSRARWLCHGHTSTPCTHLPQKTSLSPPKLLTHYLESMDLGVRRKGRKEIVLPVPKENDPVQILNETMIHVLVLKAGGEG